jgi:hypothetical protein
MGTKKLGLKILLDQKLLLILIGLNIILFPTESKLGHIQMGRHIIHFAVSNHHVRCCHVK